MEKSKPKEYHGNSSVPLTFASKLFDEFIPKINFTRNDMVLDIGCGPGSVTTKVIYQKLPHFKKIIGMDYSEEMINFAKEAYKEHLPKLEFEVGDIEADPEAFSNYFEYFDHITSISLWQWLKNQP